MLDDPLINFAIATPGHALGMNHLDFQVERDAELEALNMTYTIAGLIVIEDYDAVCCDANSNKYWTMDPQGLAWEHFRTLRDVPIFGADAMGQSDACGVAINTRAEAASSLEKACCDPVDPSDCC